LLWKSDMCKNTDTKMKYWIQNITVSCIHTQR